MNQAQARAGRAALALALTSVPGEVSDVVTVLLCPVRLSTLKGLGLGWISESGSPVSLFPIKIQFMPMEACTAGSPRALCPLREVWIW